MKYYDQSVKINHNLNWSYIPDNLYRILTTGGSGSGKPNVLFILTKSICTSKIHSNQSINYLLTEEKKQELKNQKNPKAFIEYSQTNDDIYENLEDHNPMKKRKVLILFDNVIVDMESNKQLSPVVTELFLRGRKLNILLVFTSQPCFNLTKTIRLNATYYFVMKIPNKRELQQILKKLYKDYTKEPYPVLVNNTTLPSDNPLRFKNSILQK